MKKLHGSFSLFLLMHSSARTATTWVPNINLKNIQVSLCHFHYTSHISNDPFSFFTFHPSNPRYLHLVISCDHSCAACFLLRLCTVPDWYMCRKITGKLYFHTHHKARVKLTHIHTTLTAVQKKKTSDEKHNMAILIVDSHTLRLLNKCSVLMITPLILSVSPLVYFVRIINR